MVKEALEVAGPNGSAVEGELVAPGAAGSGGEGLLFSQRDVELAKDFHLIEASIKGGWPTTPEVRQLAIAKAIRCMNHPNPKISLLAQRIVIAADGINARRESTAAREGRPVAVVNNFGTVDNRRIVLMLPDNGRGEV